IVSIFYTVHAIISRARNTMPLFLPPVARFAALLALALTYATISIRTKPPGVARLLMSLPVVLLFSMGPMQLFGHESILVSGSLAFTITLLGNLKLLAFSANRGPLAYPGLTAVQWLMLLLLPYYPVKRR
ncbi:hypothetical protein Agub_g5164, partial [Astrephomene gubernaculifera]